MIERGARLDILDNAGFTPLGYAKFKGWNTEECVNNGKNTERFIEIKDEEEIVFKNEYLESNKEAMFEDRTPLNITTLRGQTTIAEEPKPLFGQFKRACQERNFEEQKVIDKLLLPNYESFFNELGITRHVEEWEKENLIGQIFSDTPW
ncbi:MAG: hypothetical protein LN589_03255 [Rickettsia endosymbiont of Eriopis connexa]|nr:hypothetical protein [Rickettsia endosymbiont of Eriopis connexa]